MFKLQILSILTVFISLSAMSAERVNITDEQLQEAQERAHNKMGRIPDLSTNKFDWSKVPQPLIKYNGNLASSTFKLSGLNNNIRLESISPKKKIKVFVSFSMPEESLKKYAREIGHLPSGEASMVLNGLDKSKDFVKTIQHMQKIVYGTGAEFELDPTSFVRFGVKQVPAIVVYTDDPMYEAKCAVQGKIDLVNKSEKFVGVYGDVSVGYALDYMEEQYAESDFSPFIHKELKLLRGLK